MIVGAFARTLIQGHWRINWYAQEIEELPRLGWLNNPNRNSLCEERFPKIIRLMDVSAPKKAAEPHDPRSHTLPHRKNNLTEKA